MSAPIIPSLACLGFALNELVTAASFRPEVDGRAVSRSGTGRGSAEEGTGGGDRGGRRKESGDLVPRASIAVGPAREGGPREMLVERGEESCEGTTKPVAARLAACGMR